MTELVIWSENNENIHGGISLLIAYCLLRAGPSTFEYLDPHLTVTSFVLKYDGFFQYQYLGVHLKRSYHETLV